VQHQVCIFNAKSPLFKFHFQCSVERWAPGKYAEFMAEFGWDGENMTVFDSDQLGLSRKAAISMSLYYHTVYLEMLQSRCTAETCALTSAALLIEDGAKPEPAMISGLHELCRQGLNLLLLEGFEVREEMSRLIGTTKHRGFNLRLLPPYSQYIVCR
jgi:hypothetical protein